MEQNIKNAIKRMREEIATLEKVQKDTKKQRKTENFHGERTMPHWVAEDNARLNKKKLRAMYAAYGLMRGKKFSQIESAAKPLGEPWYDGIYVDIKLRGKHPLVLYLPDINAFLERYGYCLPFTYKKNCWGQDYKEFSTENCEEIICLSQQEA